MLCYAMPCHAMLSINLTRTLQIAISRLRMLNWKLSVKYSWTCARPVRACWRPLGRRIIMTGGWYYYVFYMRARNFFIAKHSILCHQGNGQLGWKTSIRFQRFTKKDYIFCCRLLPCWSKAAGIWIRTNCFIGFIFVCFTCNLSV